MLDGGLVVWVVVALMACPVGGFVWFQRVVRPPIRRRQAEHIVWCRWYGMPVPPYRFPATWRLADDLLPQDCAWWHQWNHLADEHGRRVR